MPAATRPVPRQHALSCFLPAAPWPCSVCCCPRSWPPGHPVLTSPARPALAPPPQIMAIAPALLPELLAILRSDEYGAPLQRKALAILHTILEVLQVRGARG